MKINYVGLRTGDIVLYRDKSLFTRIIEWVSTRGKDSIPDVVATHVGILVNFNGQYIVAEMLSKGLSLTSLEEANRNIIGVRRSKMINALDRREIDKKIAYDFRKGLEYDWAGDLAFIFKKLIQHSEEKYFCSEYVAHLLRDLGGVVSRVKPSAITPFDLQGNYIFPSLEDVAYGDVDENEV